MATKFELKAGGYPAEYDAAKHGPYDPARYYGKREFVHCACRTLAPLLDHTINNLM